MRTLYVIGIGAGDPEQLTLQAIKAMNRTDVFFLVDKGATKSELVDIRRQMLADHVRDKDYRVVEIPDPPRDRAAAAYESAVTDWHHRRAGVFSEAINRELGDEGVGAFLVWGDPALYDSTLRIFDLMLAAKSVEFEYEVIPGITSIQALTAKHRIPMNRIGESIHITTGRHLAEGLPAGVDNAIIMLDGSCTFTQVPGDDVDVYWGGNVGTPDEVLIAGSLRSVEHEIEVQRAELKERAGWVMDTYLLRRRKD
ncbi:precorrin-6A synthase (deacetylating) [Hoyosella subflava]|uniref:Precorrin-6A synthase n=1 Tax=Hoyosella subflava (strain DSM 45089 / JCM 17490 / NBRC 109087 / DQS3-9A1) TaxID=443218 RepID=F6ES25_HOYSD|nr:precorrin-6A synthase (deacetylating) [Hoyosella subflava]AEF42029.1 Precorrin-6A synthase [Hoyosella subflava DQS3-9A1]